MKRLRVDAISVVMFGVIGLTAIAIVSSVAPGADGKVDIPRLIAFIDWNIAAAFVEGAAAVAIVVLTYQLARTARAALATSADQVRAAQQSNLLSRRDAHVAAVPRLELERASWVDTLDTTESADSLTFSLSNLGEQPALDVHVTVSESDAVGGTSGEPPVNETVGTLLPGKSRAVAIDMYLLRNKAKPTDTRVAVGAKWSANTMVVAVRFRASLGQQVVLSYLWTANHPNQLDEGVWQLIDYWVQPDINGAEPLRMHFGGW